ncbi:MFS transporter, SP family, general alpha glucoside:H+ symporter [Cryptococcus neoformans]|nr:MFS transporter, SP family, general alpha glucoside:H+ symporter [Cryptococcus neoformans var. grubii]
MKHTNAIEKTMAEGTSYWDCFRGVDLRRTEIAAAAWMIQNLCGSAFMGYSTFFLEQAGLPVTQAFNLSIAQYALGICGTIVSWILMGRVGRRRLYLVGLAGMVAFLVVIGGLGFISVSTSGAQWAIGALLLVYTALYDATVGPVCYTIVASLESHMSSVNIVNAVIMPYFLNSGKLNWGAKTGLFWGGFASLCFIWTFFRLPEAKDRTYGELDVLFENKIPARKFASTVVDQFVGHEDNFDNTIAVETFDKKLSSKPSVAHVELNWKEEWDQLLSGVRFYFESYKQNIFSFEHVRGSRDLGGRSRYGLRRRGVEEAADGGNSEFAARCELAGSGEVGPERASGKVETDAELAIAELGDWLADDEFATEGGSEQMETAFEGSAEPPS